MIRSILIALCLMASADPRAAASGVAGDLQAAQASVVKVYGLGGVAGLEGYQTGVFVESSGVVVTIDSTVLESGAVSLVDAYGDRYEGRVVGRDAETGLALVACPESTTPPGFLTLEGARQPRRAEPVWALSNAFAIAEGNEAVTAQRGRLAAITRMPVSVDAERTRTSVGVPRVGSTVLLLDAVTSNPGAGGGVVIGRGGVLLGVLGAECRSSLTGSWINYAVPASAVRDAIGRIRSGERSVLTSQSDRDALDRARLREIGIVMIPAVTRRTPPFVERVVAKSLADRAGLRADDLIVAVSDTPIGVGEAAAAAIVEESSRAEVELTVVRGQRVLTLTLPRVAP
ncbi:Putative serine protease HhoA precursor [Planctomycetes bacterium MalM25]|nr:Putative serine protease HhoA precursor [Planctomycetes bacterium MalM25]